MEAAEEIVRKGLQQRGYELHFQVRERQVERNKVHLVKEIPFADQVHDAEDELSGFCFSWIGQKHEEVPIPTPMMSMRDHTRNHTHRSAPFYADLTDAEPDSQYNLSSNVTFITFDLNESILPSSQATSRIRPDIPTSPRSTADVTDDVMISPHGATPMMTLMDLTDLTPDNVVGYVRSLPESEIDKVMIPNPLCMIHPPCFLCHPAIPSGLNPCSWGPS